jgi:hypothetical protein
MVARARKLRNEIQAFLQDEKKFNIEISDDEWRQVDYLVEILFPFCVWTNVVGRTRKEPTIHDSFKIYNRLFEHLESQMQKLRPKRRTPWKIQLMKALEKGHQKLSYYYAKTHSSLGYIYGVATLLAPEYKREFFEGSDWEVDVDGKDWVSNLFLYLLL